MPTSVCYYYRSPQKVTRRHPESGSVLSTFDDSVGQTRYSGDPHITHPLAVATLLAGLGASYQALCAAPLHDTTAYTHAPCTFAELNREFGIEITGLVAAVPALDQIRYRDAGALARALGASEAADLQIPAIKVADRLRSMCIVEFLSPDKQLRKATEPREVLGPAARLLRLDPVEAELATLASATLSHNRHVRTTSGRRSLARFAAHMLLGVPRLAATLRRPAPDARRVCP